MTIKHIALAGVILLLTTQFITAADQQGFIGDKSDGSRSQPVHLIELYDETGEIILPDDDPALPFSTRQTCGQCHDYETISHGWHFNAGQNHMPPGRKAQPWIYYDPGLFTQVPLSYRNWQDTYQPEIFGITKLDFIKRFGSKMPGGGVGENDYNIPQEIMRQYVSGKSEINCLICHNRHWGQDGKEYAIQKMRENFRWAPTASCEFAKVSGSAKDMPDTFDYMMPDMIMDSDKSPPAVEYDPDAFDSDNMVLFDITAKIPDKRCYFCHSNMLTGKGFAEKWMNDEDVHLNSGLLCVDCHRNGLEHDIVRGYPEEEKFTSNPLAGKMTCESCHAKGKLSSPIPRHKGIPAVHFEILTCTACHSGPLPKQQTAKVKTSRNNYLGVFHGVNIGIEPEIITPVFAVNENNKIAPHNLIWPAYWAKQQGNDFVPIKLDIVEKIIKNLKPEQLNEQSLTELLEIFAEKLNIKAGYITGGNVFIIKDNKLQSFEHKDAKPYLWPIAHDVRPLGESMGFGSCKQCHSAKAPFFFGEVEIDILGKLKNAAKKYMYEFEKVDPLQNRIFAFTFIFRPWFKAFLVFAGSTVGLLLLFYALKALDYITNLISTGKE